MQYTKLSFPFGWTLVLSSILVGCADAERDERMVLLEKRVDKLEARLAAVSRMPSRDHLVPRDVPASCVVPEGASRRRPLTPEQEADRQRIRENVRQQLENRRARARQQRPEQLPLQTPAQD